MSVNERTNQAAVAVQDVRKTYQVGEPVHALDGVSLKLKRGSYTAVMGPSGSGKSTLMNLIGCLDTPTEGRVIVNGKDVTQLSSRERTRLRGSEIGFVFQTFNLMPRLTAQENIVQPMVAQKVSRSERNERAKQLLERVGLGDRAGHRPNELSGGQRQRVSIARALANDPALILTDEPTGNLDSKTGANIMELFSELHEGGNTILMVTHDRDIAEHADKIIHLLDGVIEREETVDSPVRPTVGGGE
ncbi:ABC transporter ATP-binding protein [Halosimplex rubrum]|uniref:ABC transporter ATP-binding protein n=1 Tax=Halosimplex rubrum TaxID=869889 RepID=A0A7D5T889_9EURY|nr:ABC transporter ATP-binding protein [Halosimplex rubrum]QLH79673.1 ABC transporter ATP-binding protein [Halosimplex rubrum]